MPQNFNSTVFPTTQYTTAHKIKTLTYWSVEQSGAEQEGHEHAKEDDKGIITASEAP